MSKRYWTEDINENARRIKELDFKEPFYAITSSEFDEKKEDSSLIAALTGESVFEDWQSFAEAFRKHQLTMGFSWQGRRGGKGGKVELLEVKLPAELGEELARKEMDANVEEGRIDELVFKQLTDLYNYLGDRKDIINIVDVKIGFGQFTEGKQRYKFRRGPGGLGYTLKLNEVELGKGQKKENKLGEDLVPVLKQALKLDQLSHTQSGRRKGKLQNADLEGFRIQRGIDGDRFLMYSFELKPSNYIDQISQAIAQAVNYQVFSNFTYIVIPSFDRHLFHDPERYEELVEMCRNNKLGVISIEAETEIGGNDYKIVAVIEVLAAQKLELEDRSNLLHLIQESCWEMCPICRRIVQDEIRTQHCGWKIGDKGDCMKRRIEDIVLNTHLPEGQE